MRVDLHTHTCFSDGKLSPEELVQRALKKQVSMLSITDHDTVAAYTALEGTTSRLTIIPGIELSTHWSKMEIHVVGLNIRPDSDAMDEAVDSQQQARMSRARYIAERLEKAGIPDPLAGAGKIAGNRNIGRPHFAQYLVEKGICKSPAEAFKKYLSSGNLRQHWADLPTVVNWIRDAGGIAVLAHPLKYKLTYTKLKELVDDFIQAGGQGLEVISGKQPTFQVRKLARLCEQTGLLASCGSDFHQPDLSWAELGQYPPLPKDCMPVWEQFR